MGIDRVARAESLMECVREDAALAGAIKAAPDAAGLRDVLAAAGYGDVSRRTSSRRRNCPATRGTDALTDEQLEQIAGGASGPNIEPGRPVVHDAAHPARSGGWQHLMVDPSKRLFRQAALDRLSSPSASTSSWRSRPGAAGWR